MGSSAGAPPPPELRESSLHTGKLNQGSGPCEPHLGVARGPQRGLSSQWVAGSNGPFLNSHFPFQKAKHSGQKR